MKKKTLKLLKENAALCLCYEDKELVDVRCDNMKAKSEFISLWEVLKQQDVSRVASVSEKSGKYLINEGISEVPLSCNQFFNKVKQLLSSMGYELIEE